MKSHKVNLFLADFTPLEPLFVVAAKQNNKKILLQSQMDGKRERESEKKVWSYCLSDMRKPQNMRWNRRQYFLKDAIVFPLAHLLILLLKNTAD